MDISDWRTKIDVLDETLVELLNRRAQYALKIGEIKKANNQPIYSPRRERTVLDKVQKLNKGPLSDDAVKGVFEKIIDESRRLEGGQAVAFGNS